MIHIIQVVFFQRKRLHTFIGHQAQNQNGKNRDARNQKKFFGNGEIEEKFFYSHGPFTNCLSQFLQGWLSSHKEQDSQSLRL
jgi:hypothetical protein